MQIRWIYFSQVTVAARSVPREPVWRRAVGEMYGHAVHEAACLQQHQIRVRTSIKRRRAYKVPNAGPTGARNAPQPRNAAVPCASCAVRAGCSRYGVKFSDKLICRVYRTSLASTITLVCRASEGASSLSPSLPLSACATHPLLSLLSLLSLSLSVSLCLSLSLCSSRARRDEHDGW